MAEHDDAPLGEDDLTLDIPADDGAGAPQDDDTPEHQDAPEGDGEQPEPDEDEFEISFGDEAAPAQRGDNSDLVKHLRAEIRKRDEMLATRPPVPAPQVIDPGPKPTLEGCDYDSDKFEAELDAWKDRTAKAKEVQTQAQQQSQQEAERFQARLQAYGDGKSALKAKDFDVAETAVTSAFTPIQQAVALKAASDPAKLVYALGKYPQKLAEIAKLQDPIEFAVAVAKLEGQLKVTQRNRTPPEPDTPQRGSGPNTGGKVDPVRDRLEREAAKTGDRTAIVRYNREQKAKAEARKAR